MVTYSHDILYSKAVKIASEEVNKFNTEKGQDLQLFGRYPRTENIPDIISVVKKKEKLSRLQKLIGLIYPPSAYDELVGISTLTPTVFLHDTKYEDLAKRIEERLKS